MKSVSEFKFSASEVLFPLLASQVLVTEKISSLLDKMMSHTDAVEQTAKRKVSFFSFVLVGRISFHCLEYSNEIQLKRQMRKNKRNKETTKAEISVKRLN